MIRKIFFLLAILSLSPLEVFSQKNLEQNFQSSAFDRKDIRSLILQGNKIRTIIYNTGSVSSPGVLSNVYDLTWNGLGYAYEFGFIVGSKVPVNNSGDSVRIIIDGFGASNSSTADGDFAPDGVTKWGWLPKAGFARDGQNDVANNQNPSSWPESWTSWKGKYGNPLADLESYYVLTDSSDSEFPYYPYPNDSTKRGLGLQTEVRHYLFSHPNLEDMFLTVFDIKNVSQKNLPAVVAAIHGDPHIGGSNNFSDDASNFDSTRSLAYSWDPDNKSDIPALSPGYFGALLTETPLNKGLTSYASLAWGGYNRPKNDSLMYEMTTPGIFTYSTFYPQNENLGDNLMLLASGYFPLETGNTATFGIAYLFGYDLFDLKVKADYINQTYDLFFNPRGPEISILSPSKDQKVETDQVQIQWSNATLTNDSTVTLYYGNTYNAKWWNEIGKKIPNTGSYQWNVTGLPDGIFYKVHIVNNNGTSISYDSSEGYFSINRAGDAAPQLVLLSPLQNFYTGTIPVRWIAGDADGDPVAIKIHYSENDGSSYKLLEQVSNTGSYQLDTRKVANTPAAKVKLEAVANGKSIFAESKSFRIANFYFALTDTASQKHSAGKGSGMVFPGVADSSALTGNKYQVTFDSLNGSLRYTLKNLTTNTVKLTGESLNSTTGSGTLIDGMRLWFRNDPTGLDSIKSKFSTGGISNITARYAKPSAGTFHPIPYDLQLEFSSLDTNSSGDFIFPADSLGNLANPFGKIVKVPFVITNLTDTTKIQAFVRKKINVNVGRWSVGDEIIILTPPPYKVDNNNTTIGLTLMKTNSLNTYFIPNGTKYMMYSTKPFTTSDVFEFTADAKFGKPTTIPKDKLTPTEFTLEQNYPNPFNPETKIQFSIPKKGMTTLKIFDAIGREVQTLIEEELPQGVYSELWNGKNRFNQIVSSGVYFYRLQSGSFTQTKKMILMR